MAPHALLSASPPPADAVSESSDVYSPFGPVSDPQSLSGDVYSSANTVVAQAIYSVLSKIFSYETPGLESLLDGPLRQWASVYHRTNAFGVVPLFHRFEVRSGAANAILGYYARNGSSGLPLAAVGAASLLTYMVPTLSGSQATVLPLALSVSAVDFDSASGALVSNYVSSLSAARALQMPVFTPVDASNGRELQHMAVLNHYVALLTGRPSIHLFDGPEFARRFLRFSLLAPRDLGLLYQQLLNATGSRTPETADEAVEAALATFNSVAGTKYAQFEYQGAQSPKTVFVVYGSHEAAQVAQIVARLPELAAVGVVKIRVPVPFNLERFAAVLPESTKNLVVFSQSFGSSVSSLGADITAALFVAEKYHQLAVSDFSYGPEFVWTPITISKILNKFVPSLDPALILRESENPVPLSLTANTSPFGKFLVWGRDSSGFAEVVNKLALSLSLDDSKTVSLRTKFDNLAAGGLFQSQLSSVTRGNAISTVDSADVVLIEDVSLLESYDILATSRPGGHILLANNRPVKTSLEEDFLSKFSADFKRSLARNHSKLTVIDFSVLEEIDTANDATKGFSGEFLVQLAFWRAALPELEAFYVNKLLQANGGSFELLAAVLDKFIATVDEKKGLKEVNVLPEWADLEEEVPEKSSEDSEEASDAQSLPYFPVETSFSANPRNDGVSAEETIHGGYLDLATRLVFPEAYGVKHELRPELPVKNFVVKVQENKRLTPLEYSRNIFHIEFDTTGTGLTYNIGEALGIHGKNRPEDVEAFLQFYGVDGESLVEISNKDDASLLEIRSARQSLTETVDFLGKPPKRFYEALANYADGSDKEKLQALASSAGAADLKKRMEVDFCTYVDILEEFLSARPSFAELIKIIAPLKRREYSIASSQRVHENAVHLLVVVVDWVDPKGRTRYGHCSKFLADLAVGDELVVSVKPSVMKLPPLSTQPIVMSGLGTGLAPFKAFVEEKVWQKQQGLEIGEIYLYLGSRHKKEEYLYGELWEAYKDAGLLTHIGAAFSRDQPQKIYIQDKIRESIHELTDAIVSKNGAFYLCGPTWPVPDITACLEDIVRNGAKLRGEDLKDAAKVVEDMKEDGRYILEVY